MNTTDDRPRHPLDAWKRPRRRHLYATVGMVLGFIALCVAALETHLVADEPEPPVNKRGVLEIGTGKRTLTVKLGKEEPPAPPRKPKSLVHLASTLLGLGAIGLGTFSWIKKEHIRMSGGAVALGLMAVAWQWVLLGVGLAILIFVLANLMA